MPVKAFEKLPFPELMEDLHLHQNDFYNELSVGAQGSKGGGEGEEDDEDSREAKLRQDVEDLQDLFQTATVVLY